MSTAKLGLSFEVAIPLAKLRRRDRYGHSPHSWPKLWQQVYSEIESPEWAARRVVVCAEVTDDWGRGGGGQAMVKSASGSKLLYWSVEIV